MSWISKASLTLPPQRADVNRDGRGFDVFEFSYRLFELVVGGNPLVRVVELPPFGNADDSLDVDNDFGGFIGDLDLSE